jgi:hypothetical protein
MFRERLSLVASVGLGTLLCGASPAFSQSLGAASSFAIGGSAGVTAGGAGATVTGDVGSSPNGSITGFPPAVVVAPFGLHGNDAAAIAAQSAASSLFTALGAGACTSNPAPQLSGASFGPGIYCLGAADLAAGGVLTLNGAGTYIFRTSSSLTANVGSSVVLAGADPCNVFWQVTSAATLNGNNFAGNVVAQAGVTLGVGASLTGRALAINGPVTLSGGNTAGGCSVPAVVPTPTPSPTPVPTLSQWSMIALTFLLALTGFMVLRHRAA